MLLMDRFGRTRQGCKGLLAPSFTKDPQLAKSRTREFASVILGLHLVPIRLLRPPEDARLSMARIRIVER